jgi:hypothetical protein
VKEGKAWNVIEGKSGKVRNVNEEKFGMQKKIIVEFEERKGVSCEGSRRLECRKRKVRNVNEGRVWDAENKSEECE